MASIYVVLSLWRPILYVIDRGRLDSYKAPVSCASLLTSQADGHTAPLPPAFLPPLSLCG